MFNWFKKKTVDPTETRIEEINNSIRFYEGLIREYQHSRNAIIAKYQQVEQEWAEDTVYKVMFSNIRIPIDKEYMLDVLTYTDQIASGQIHGCNGKIQDLKMELNRLKDGEEEK